MKTKLHFYLFLFLFSISTAIYAQPKNNKFLIQSGEEQWSIEQILSEYIQVKSVSGSEKEAGEFLKNICLDNSLHITQMGDSDGNYNFTASIRSLSSGLPNIIFLNHIDVIPAGDTSQWEHPPFSGHISDTEIWGRGAFDNKGAAIMQLASIIEIARYFNNKPIPYNITFLAVSCEETQCEGGVKYVIDNYFKKLNPEVIIGEGPPALTNILSSDPDAHIFGISVAHKRAFWVQLELEVKTSGHGSVTPIEYANKEMVIALDRLVNEKRKAIFNPLNTGLLKQLGKLEKGIPAFVLKHPRLFKSLVVPQLRKKPELFALFTNTITLTSIDSDNKVVNVIPNKISALLDCRLLPSESSTDFLLDLKRLLNNNAIKISIINEMPVLKPASEKNLFYKNIESVLSENYPESHVVKVFLPNFNDADIFRSKGVPAFSTIPVKLKTEYLTCVHSFNERIPKTILAEGQKNYSDFLKKCLE
jgi:carboxypeptidase PM20D1